MHKFPDKPHLVGFVPSLGCDSYYVPEIFSENRTYVLHSVVREEEGIYTASYYSSATQKFYEFRNGKLQPTMKRPPPVCNARERYVFLLFVVLEVSEHFGNYTPVRPFSPLYETVEVFEPDYRGTRSLGLKSVEELRRDESRYHYYTYDRDRRPFPSIPLASICGRSVFRIPVRETDATEPFYLVWNERADGIFVPELRPTGPGAPPFADVDESHRLAVVRDNVVVQLLATDRDPENWVTDGLLIMRVTVLPGVTAVDHPAIVAVSFATKTKRLLAFCRPPRLLQAISTSQSQIWEELRVQPPPGPQAKGCNKMFLLRKPDTDPKKWIQYRTTDDFARTWAHCVAPVEAQNARDPEKSKRGFVHMLIRLKQPGQPPR
jgi:hypothetical protein